MGEYQYDTEVLTNGLRLCWLNLPHVHSTFLGAFVRAGAAYETADNNGVSHLLEHLHLATSPQHPSRAELLQAIDNIPGCFYAETELDLINFGFDLLPSHLAAAAELLTEILEIRPHPPDIVETEKRLVVSELDQGESDFLRQGQALPFSAGPYHLPWAGIPQNVRRLADHSIASFDQRAFAPHRITVVVVGPITSIQRKETREQFERLQRSERDELPLPEPQPLGLPLVKRLRPTHTGCPVMIGFRAGHGLDIEHRAAVTFLGIGLDAQSSPFFKAVRYSRGSTYEFSTASYRLANWDVLYFYGHPSTKARDGFISGVLAECRRLREADTSPDWFGAVKHKFRYGISRAKDSAAALGNRIGQEEARIVGREPMSIEQELDALEALSLEHLRAYCQQLFSIDNLFVLFQGRTRPFDKQRVKRLIRALF